MVADDQGAIEAPEVSCGTCPLDHCCPTLANGPSMPVRSGGAEGDSRSHTPSAHDLLTGSWGQSDEVQIPDGSGLSSTANWLTPRVEVDLSRPLRKTFQKLTKDWGLSIASVRFLTACFPMPSSYM